MLFKYYTDYFTYILLSDSSCSKLVSHSTNSYIKGKNTLETQWYCKKTSDAMRRPYYARTLQHYFYLTHYHPFPLFIFVCLSPLQHLHWAAHERSWHRYADNTALLADNITSTRRIPHKVDTACRKTIYGIHINIFMGFHYFLQLIFVSDFM